MAPSGVTAMFKPQQSGQAVATLFLIENSQTMASVWPHLRDHYLPTLLGAMRVANPIVPIQILLLTSCPVAEERGSAATTPARQYYDLPDVKFNGQPDNRISAHNIERAIQLVARTFNDVPTSRHIVIIAASRPSEDLAIDDTPPGVFTRRQMLVQRMKQETIQCHMILSPTANTEPLRALFYEILHSQNNEEASPWMLAGPETYRFYLSARPPSTIYHSAPDSPTAGIHADMPTAPLTDSSSSSASSGFIPGREGSSSAASVTPEDPAPSLVSRLQKVHGLTKKKIYGTQPTPQPFFRSERVRDKYKQIPTPLAIPSSTPATVQTTDPTSPDGRSMARSKLDRKKWLGEKPGALGLYDPHGARMIHPQSPHSSGASSPDIDTPVSSPAYMTTYPPFVPAGAGFSETVDPAAMHTTLAGSYDKISMLSAKTPRAGSMASSPILPISSDGLPWMTDNNHMPNFSYQSSTLYDEGASHKALHSSPIPPLSQPFQNAGIPVKSDSLLQTGASAWDDHNMPPAQDVSVDDGDRPFIFCPEYEAAAAARLQAVLKLSSDATPLPFTSTAKIVPGPATSPSPPAGHVTRANYEAAERYLGTPVLSSQPSYADGPFHMHHLAGAYPTDPYAPDMAFPPSAYSSSFNHGTSSSLQGWSDG